MKNTLNYLKDNIENIELKINYVFKNKNLLIQAFTRRTYGEEHNKSLDNEVLEFLGDTILDFYVAKYIDKNFGAITCNTIYTEDNDKYMINKYDNEEKLSNIKSDIVENKNLALIVDKLGLDDFLLLSNGEIINNIEEHIKIKGDLLEAIVGAVAKDCNWDDNKLYEFITKLLDLNYVLNKEKSYLVLINEWFDKQFKEKPNYIVERKSSNYVVSLTVPTLRYNKRFKVEENNLDKAKEECAKQVYNDLLDHNEYDIDYKILPKYIGRNSAIEALHLMYQNSLIEKPIYRNEDNPDYYDENGNAIWHATCTVKVKNKDLIYEESASSKNLNDCRKDASFKCFIRYFNIEQFIYKNGFILDSVINRPGFFDFLETYQQITGDLLGDYNFNNRKDFKGNELGSWDIREDKIVCKFYLKYKDKWTKHYEEVDKELKDKGFNRNESTVRKRINVYAFLHTGKGTKKSSEQARKVYKELTKKNKCE